MSSAHAADAAGHPADEDTSSDVAAGTQTDDGPGDRTARARIRDAALHLFGERGFRSATVRDIAERAEVSPALVLHHFGSKQGLREAVDEHLLADIRAGKVAAMTGGLTPDDATYRQQAAQMAPRMAYLARALAEDAELGRRLYDRMFADALAYVAAGVDAGVLQAGEDHEARTAVLLNNGLATMLLQTQAQRVLGIDDPVDLAVRLAGPTLDLYVDGLFADDRFRAAWRAESDHVAGVADPDPPPPPATEDPSTS